MANDANDEVLRFATRYDLAVKQRDSRYHIPGSNGYIMQEERTPPGRLRAGIMYLSNWERVKKEFRLSYRHCIILPSLMPDLRSNSINVEFAGANERQAKLIIELIKADKV